MKKGRKIIGIILSAILLLTAIACLLTATGKLNGIIIQQIIFQANKTLNAELTVGELNGNPFTHLMLRNVALVQDGREILHIESADLDYSLMRLFKKEIAINKIKISELKVNIWQDRDSIWNVQKLVKPSDKPPVNKPESGFSLVLNLIAVECTGFSATVLPLDSSSNIPKSVEANLSMSFLMKKDIMELKLKELTLKTARPAAEIKSLNFDFSSDSISWKWNHLRLQTSHSQLLSEGKYFPARPFLSSGKITIDTLAFDDIRRFVPQFNLHGNPSVTLSAEGENDRINLSVLVKEQQQKCEINGWIKSLKTIPEYDLAMDVQDIDGSTWTGKPEYATKITGQIQAKGRGYDPQKATLTASGNFPELTYQDKTLKNLIFEAEKDSAIIKGNLATESWFGGLAADFSIADYLSKFRYSILCSGKNIDLAKIYFPKNMYSSINLNIKAHGEGINPLKGSVKANIVSSGSTITNRPIDEFHTSFSYTNGNYDVTDLNLNSPFFRLEAAGKGNIQHENDIRFNFETKDFDDLLKLTGLGQYSMDGKIVGQLTGNINQYSTNAKVNISRFTKDSLTMKDFKGYLNLAKDSTFHADSKIKLGEVSMGSQVFQNLGADMNIILAEEISLGFKLDADSVSINHKNLGALKGEAMLYTDDSLRFNAQIKLDSLSYFPIKTGASDLNFKARLSKGENNSNLTAALRQLTNEFNYKPFVNYLSLIKSDSAKINGHLNLHNFSYDTLSIDKVEANLDVIANLNTIKGTLSTSVDSLVYNKFNLEKGTLHTSFLNKNFRNELDLTFNDSINSQSNFDVDLGENIDIGLQHFTLKAPHITWNGGSDSTKLVYGKNSVEIRNLLISANDQNYIKAEGIIAFKGNESMDINFRGFNLEDINEVAGGKIPLQGNLDASIQLTGTSDQPKIKANLNLKNLKAYDKNFDRMEANLLYQGDTVKIGGSWNVGDTLMFDAALKSPYHLSLEDTAFRMPSPADQINAKFKLNHFNLALLKPFLGPDQIDIQGDLNSEVEASGPFNNLNINGFADWKDGKFYMPEYGLLYDKVRLNAGIKNDSIFIHEFKAESGTGSLQLNGYSKLDQQNSYAPKVISLRLIGKEFKVVDSDRMQATINTNITLNNEAGHPVFAGNLDILRSEVNADAFIADYNKASDEADLPMLIKALQNQTKKKDQALQNDSVSKKPNPKMEFYNKLRGSFNITIPRNLWIRGKDMGIEVKGDLRAVKEGLSFVLFGEMEVKQGFYRFYGKRFDFKSGKLTLTGDEDINPVLDFVVAYSFRDYEKTLKSLEMIITGRLKDPQIAFQMNGSKIDEQDALSYIVFGCSMAELSEGQESTLDISTSTIAKNVAFGQMSSVLQDAVQSSLKLDVVEIAGEDNWDAASVTVGKYINNNLYMSYQYTFALDKKTKIVEPQKISVEYQFFKFLSLKATNQSPNSGLDLIFKKEYK